MTMTLLPWIVSAYFLGIATAIAAYVIGRRVSRWHDRKTVYAIANCEPVELRFSPLQRARMLREFNRGKG